MGYLLSNLLRVARRVWQLLLGNRNPVNEFVHQLLQRLPGGYWLDVGLEEVRQRTAGIRLSDRDVVTFVEEIARNLDRNRPGRTTNLLILGLLMEGERFLQALRVSGALRPSKYDFNGELIRACVAPLVERADQIGLSELSRRYLASLRAFSCVADGARKLRDHLLTALQDGHTIKSLLVALDTIFLIGHDPSPRDFPPNVWRHHSKEALAEGFSIGLYLYRLKGRHIRDEELSGPVDPLALTSDSYRNLLAECTIFREYHGWEFEVDSGTYQADIEGRKVILRPADERAEKATRLGFITVEQSQLKAAMEKPKEAMSLATFAEGLHKVLKETGHLRMQDQPRRRLVLAVPMHLVEIISADSLFAEEVAYLNYSGLSFLVAPEDLTAFVVRGGVTVLDLVKASRVVNIFRQVLRLELQNLFETEPETAAQSMLPVFRREQLLTLLSAAVSKEKAEELLRFWEWTGEGVFDLQYQPVVRAQTLYAIPMNVFADSNIIRNALQLARVRIHPDEDPSEHTLANAFRARDVPTQHGVEYRHSDQSGEIDVLTVLDGFAFAFECKNSLLPANPFELRQTLTYLGRANEQLDRLRRFWEDPVFVQGLREKTGLDLVQGMPLVTCAVTANRMLSGSLFGKHPVRGLFELGSFLHQGGVVLLGQTVRMIAGARVSGEDLRAYIEGDSLHARIFLAMVPHEPVYKVGPIEVMRRTFALNFIRLAEEFGLELPEDLGGASTDKPADAGQD